MMAAEHTPADAEDRLAYWLPRLTGLFAASLGLVALIGWHLQWLALPHLGLSAAPMTYNAALLSLTGGIGLLFVAIGYRRSTIFLGMATAGLALLTIVNNLFGLSLDHDPLFLRNGLNESGPISLTTAIVFLLLGTTLIVAAIQRFRQRSVALILLGIIILGVPLYSLIGYLGEIEAFSAHGRLTRMSIPAAIALMMLGTGLTSIGITAERARSTEQLSVAELRHSIVFYTGGAVILIVVLAAVLAAIPLYRELRQSQNERLTEIAMVRSAAIAQYLLRAKSLAMEVTSRTYLRRDLQAYNRGRLSKAQLAIRSTPNLTDALEYSEESVGIIQLDRHSQPLVSVGREIPPACWPKAPTPPQRASISGPVRIDGSLYMFVRADIRPPSNGVVLGWDVLMVAMESVERILADRSDLGQTGQVSLATVKNQRVSLLRVNKTAKTPTFFTAPREVASLAREAVGRQTTIEQIDGDDMLRVARPIETSGLVVVVGISRAELYAPVDRQLMLTMVGVIALALLGALGMLLVVRPLAGGIVLKAGALEQKVTEATAALEDELAERKRYEVALQEAAEALKRSNRELEQFASIASHDLQEPLHKVISFSDMLANRLGTDLDEESRDFLKRMRNATQRMQALIDGLLEYSRVASQPQSLRQINLNEIVSDVVDDLQVRIDETGGRIEAGDLPTITASELQMRQLLQNLISNALKFHRPGAAPRISITACILRPAGPVEPGLCEVSVSDNGIGFDPKDAQRIFNPFQRLHSRATFAGTGIGLALCQKIAERHGGTISATGEPNKGSTFSIQLPITHPKGD